MSHQGIKSVIGSIVQFKQGTAIDSSHFEIIIQNMETKVKYKEGTVTTLKTVIFQFIVLRSNGFRASTSKILDSSEIQKDTCSSTDLHSFHYCKSDLTFSILLVTHQIEANFCFIFTSVKQNKYEKTTESVILFPYVFANTLIY